jgi:hypothetical protein
MMLVESDQLSTLKARIFHRENPRLCRGDCRAFVAVPEGVIAGNAKAIGGCQSGGIGGIAISKRAFRAGQGRTEQTFIPQARVPQAVLHGRREPHPQARIPKGPSLLRQSPQQIAAFLHDSFGGPHLPLESRIVRREATAVRGFCQVYHVAFFNLEAIRELCKMLM